MALTNYGELKTLIADYLARADLTAEIPDLIRQAEARLWADLRLRFMETNADLTITSATRTTALPTRYLEGRSLYIDGGGRLEYRTSVEYWELWGSKTSAEPEVFTIEGENYLWGPVPNANYTGKLLYYQQPAILSADIDTNGLFTLAPNMYIYATMLEAAPYLKNDPRLTLWSSMYEDLRDKLNAANVNDRYSGDTVLQSRLAQAT